MSHQNIVGFQVSVGVEPRMHVCQSVCQIDRDSHQLALRELSRMSRQAATRKVWHVVVRTFGFSVGIEEPYQTAVFAPEYSHFTSKRCSGVLRFVFTKVLTDNPFSCVAPLTEDEVSVASCVQRSSIDQLKMRTHRDLL